MFNRLLVFRPTTSEAAVNVSDGPKPARFPMPVRKNSMWFKKRRPRLQVQAVDDSGLIALLKELGVFDTIGKDARCARCGNVVTLESIETVFPEDGEVRFICNNAKCATALVTPDDR